MDALIQKENFMKVKDEDYPQEFNSALSDWIDENENKLNSKMILNALKLVQNQVCRDDFSKVETPPAVMAIDAMTNIYNAMENMVDNNKGSYKDFYVPLYDYMLKLLTCGPGSVHIEIIEGIVGNDTIEFAENFKKLPREKRVAVIKALKRKYYTKDKSDPEEYCSVLENMIEHFLDNLFDDEEDYPKYKDEFLDLYDYFKNNTDNNDKLIKQLLSDKADNIEGKYDGNIYKAVSNMNVLNKKIEDLGKIVKESKFPKDEDDKSQISSSLNSLFDVINENGTVEQTYDSIMNLLNILFQKKSGKLLLEIVDQIGYFFYHVDEDKHKIKKNDKLFVLVIKRLTELLKATTDDAFLSVKLVDTIVSEILVKCMSNSKEHVTLAVELISQLIKHPTLQCIEGAYDLLYDNEKFYKWKEHLPAAQEMFKTISSVNMPDNSDIVDKYVSFTETFLDQVKKCKALADLNDGMVYFAMGCLELRNENLFELGSEVAERCTFDLKNAKNLIFEVLKKVTVLFNDKEFPWDNSDSSTIAQCLVSNCLGALNNKAKELTADDRSVLVNLTVVCADKNFLHYITNEPGSVFYVCFYQLSIKLVELLDNKDCDGIEPVIPHLFNLLENDEEDIVSMANTVFYMISNKSGKPFASELDRLIKILLEAEEHNLMSAVNGAYDFNSKPVKTHFQSLMKFLNSGDASLKTYFAMFLLKVAKKQSELFTDQNVKDIIEQCMDDTSNKYQLLQVLEEVAKRKPEKIVNQTTNIIQLSNKIQSYSTYALCQILKWIGINNEKKADEVMIFLAKKLEEPEDQTVTYGLIDAMKHIGGKHRAVLEKYRSSIESLKARSPNQTTKDMCTSIIDMLEGRSLEGLSYEIEEVKDEVNVLDTRVTTNENNINEVKEDVTKTKKDVKKVKQDVNKQGQKLDAMGKVVDETVVKVEEIDKKTLSHAPYWSRDISKLLNPKDDHDWRLLASRLGYSNDDIRAWAQQSDPCMALLNEWYTTHKTSDANYAILNNLQEMDRMDAAVIVENAMKAVEQVVEDEDFDYVTPPPIFLSYQWGHQEEIKLLRQHLEMAGYDCWMDIGQMGGGDKLFEKIDRGIRAAKIIISCTTEKYAKSPNCNREVNLSTNLRKPLIPLLLENCTWPPEGSMGPIFSEYLYIQFFQSNASEQTKDDRYWPPPKFQELLMQLSMNGIVPDETKVHKMYKNWWSPIVEEIKIDKKKTANGGKADKKIVKAEQDDKSPEVFISYQWDKQKNVMLLYKRLTEIGYHCWMDIHQMGGGDSLYDKIDRGLRGCKVVLSCLTEKYTLSANCRREVSLTDSLKRPIIPLLMENITWPPRGPMSMAFTELLYIDLHSDPKVQEKWTGPKFEEMKAKIREILPDEEDDPTATSVTKNINNSNNNNARPSQPTKPTESKTPKGQPAKPAETKTQPTKPAESSPNNTSQGSYVKKATPGSRVKRFEDPVKPVAAENNKRTAHQAEDEPVPKKETSPPPQQSASPAPKQSKSCQIL